MSGVNLDALSDAQWDEWIAGCRVLRAEWALYLNSASQPNAEAAVGEEQPASDVVNHDSSAGIPSPAPAILTVASD